MKTISRHLRALFALLLAAMLFAASLCFFGGNVRAQAADRESEEYNKLYYITDNIQSKLYMQEIPEYLEEVGLSAKNIEYHYYDHYTSQDKPYMDTVMDFPWDTVKNSYVIFEMNERLHVDNKSYNANFVDFLNGVFALLKENHCKIMIIWGTEEMAMADSPDFTDFLTYADVVVNTDMEYVFMYSMYNILEQMGEDIYDTNFFLSPEFYTNHLLYADFIVPGTPPELLANYLFWENYRDKLSINDFEANYFAAIGTTYFFNPLKFVSWFEYLYNIRDYENPFPIFIYNPYTIDLSEWISDDLTLENNIYYMGGIQETLDYYIPLIMHDFITEADLTQYDNWEGACEVTYKPIGNGEKWLSCGYVKEWQTVG